MRRSTFVTGVLIVCTASTVPFAGYAAAPVSAKSGGPCVGTQAPCFTSLQAAVDAARPGDSINIRPGTYAGGVTIMKDLRLHGSGAEGTRIQGGGPVLVLGAEGMVEPPRIDIDNLTITGGVNTHFPNPSFASGGGIAIPAGADNGVGAVVHITDSVIRDNVARPEALDDCGYSCSFALGGGISNSGDLTLTDTQVVGNEVGGQASHVFGGGIFNNPMGTLKIIRGSVNENRAAATGTNGRIAEAGGIYAYGDMSMDDSEVIANTVEQSSSYTIDEDHVANAGGIALKGSARIVNSVVAGNQVAAENTGIQGFVNAFGGGIVDKGDLFLLGSSVIDNSVRVVADGQGIAEGGGLWVDVARATVTDSVIARNTATAVAPLAVQANGGGILTIGWVTLTRTRVTMNTAEAAGGPGDFPWGEPSSARGGGIASLFSDDPTHTLTLRSSVVSANNAVAGTGVDAVGGGIFSQAPTTLVATRLAANIPDQCTGC